MRVPVAIPAGVCFLAVLVVLSSCGPGAEPPPTPTATVDTLQCPNHDKGIPGGLTVLPVAGAITTVAEFHDCQRLIDPDAVSSFGPLAGIWVAEALDSLVDSLRRLNPSLDSGEADTIKGNAPAVPVGTGLTFAVIYAWDADYNSLGIHQGWNCLRLFPSSTPTVPYAARMEPLSDGELCGKAMRAEETRGTDLSVRAVKVPGMSGSDYPPVGRWEWDPEYKQQYISLKCGEAWCDVTPVPDYVPSRDYRVPASQGKSHKRVFEVKGWYDEQHLAVPGPGVGVGAKLIPAAFQGTLFPDPGIDTIDRVEAFYGYWVPAAQVGLRGPMVLYEHKLNTDMGEYPTPATMGRLNRFSICAEAPGGKKCEPLAAGLNCAPDSHNTIWYARMDPSGTKNPTGPPGPKAPKYTCVTRHDHSDLERHIPGTARWFWVRDDEKLWIRCAQGCCTAN